jgi:hypothetical protein
LKKFCCGLAVGLVIGTAAAATASTMRSVYLNRGESAIATGGETVCTVLPHNGSRDGFICQVGGDYRAKFGAIINEREVAVTQYVGFSSYRVIYRKPQSPVKR